MVTLHTPSLHRQAKKLLTGVQYSPKKLVLLHTAVSLGSTLLMTFINYLFSLQIADTGGLGGLGLRSLLSTAQSVLELVVMLALPFWEIGLIYAALRWARGENAEPAHLLQGFRRFGAVLGFRLLYGALFYVLGILLQGLLVWRCQDVLSASYCLAYDACRDAFLTPEPASQPANVPWEG